MKFTDFSKDYYKYKSPVSIWTLRNVYQNIAMPLTYFSYRLGITPNIVTVLSFVFFTIGAFLFYNSSYILAAICWVFSYSLDCADGALARFTNTGSRFGAFFDVSIDRIVSSMFLALICIHPESDSIVVVLGGVLLVSYSMISSIRPLYFPELKGYARANNSYILKLVKLPYELLDTGNMLLITCVSYYFSTQNIMMAFYSCLCLMAITYNFKIIYFKFGK
tara:strand:- start:120 stop:782 length:663 start_codon:yes stop_codon:yes gene_type:complete